jgi:hypothetical protein
LSFQKFRRGKRGRLQGDEGDHMDLPLEDMNYSIRWQLASREICAFCFCYYNEWIAWILFRLLLIIFLWKSMYTICSVSVDLMVLKFDFCIISLDLHPWVYFWSFCTSTGFKSVEKYVVNIWTWWYLAF